MRRVVFLLMMMTLAVVLASGVALAGSAVDQQQTDVDAAAILDKNTPYGQTFTAGVTSSMDKVSVLVGCCISFDPNNNTFFPGGSPPGDMIVQIFAVDASGLPTGAALAQGSVPAANFATNGSTSWRDVNLSPAVSVTSGTKYALVLTSSQAAPPPPEDYRYLWDAKNADVYSGGVAMYNPSGTWTSIPEADFAFKTYVTDNSAPAPPVIVSPANNSFDKDGTITLSGSAEANSTVRIFEVTSSGTTSKGTTTTNSDGVWSKTLTGVSNGSHTYKAKATDAANNTSGFSNAVTVIVDTVKPTGTVTINGGKATTNSRSVTLKLSATDPSPASGVAKMRFRNENTSTWTSWMAFATSKSWTLSSGAGTKTVYAQYRDRSGNISAAAKDTITYQP